MQGMPRGGLAFRFAGDQDRQMGRGMEGIIRSEAKENTKFSCSPTKRKFEGAAVRSAEGHARQR